MTTNIDEEEDLDPRIQEELDHLNQYSSEINRLENEIDEARAQYSAMFAESSRNMEQMGGKIKKQIQRARQYYEIKAAAVVAQSEVLRSARKFQTAIGVYRAAKETIALAELKLIDSQGNQSSPAMLTTAWQEMLNHAYIRVMDAEKEKALSEQEHLRRSHVFVQLESQLQTLEKKFKSSIAKARPYFEMKAKCELKLKQQKQNVSDLQQAIASAKRKYADALSRLENISEEIHESRRQKILLMFPREPGVGADSDSLCSSISESCIEKSLFPSLTKSISEDAAHLADSCSVSSGQDEDSVFCGVQNPPNPCTCSVNALDALKSDPLLVTNCRLSDSQSSNDCTDISSVGIRSSGSGSSVQGKASNDCTDISSVAIRSSGSWSSVQGKPSNESPDPDTLSSTTFTKDSDIAICCDKNSKLEMRLNTMPCDSLVPKDSTQVICKETIYSSTSKDSTQVACKETIDSSVSKDSPQVICKETLDSSTSNDSTQVICKETIDSTVSKDSTQVACKETIDSSASKDSTQVACKETHSSVCNDSPQVMTMGTTTCKSYVTVIRIDAQNNEGDEVSVYQEREPGSGSDNDQISEHTDREWLKSSEVENTASEGLENPVSAITALQKEPENSIFHPVPDESSAASTAASTADNMDKSPCVLSSTITDKIEDYEQTGVFAYLKREPASGSDCAPVCIESCQGSESSKTEEIRNENESASDYGNCL